MLNLLLAGHQMRVRSAVSLSRPFGLVVDPSNVCQLACPGCVHSASSESFDWPKATLPESRFAALLKLYGPFSIGVYFCDYGEPLLNSRTPTLVRMAKAYLLGTALSTTLSVRHFDAEAYVDSGLDHMVLSIDGVTQRVYERFRRGGNLDLVLDNLAKLVAAKRKLHRRTPFLSWNFLAFEHNAHEIPYAERIARRLGVNCFRLVSPFDVSWDDPEIRPASVRPFVRRLDWESISNTPENWNPYPDTLEAGHIAAAFEAAFRDDCPAAVPPATGHTCHWLYKNIVMDAKGRILPCCGAPRMDSQLIFGTLDDGVDPFNSTNYRRARSFFANQSRSSAEPLHCYQCEWDQTTVNIGAPEIRRYFRAANPWVFDRRSVDVLAAF
ncbi:MAG: radical SAM protein [Bryobacteraceae bacterium]